MSWAKSATKKIRRSLGVPPITLGNVVRAASTGGASVAGATGGTWLQRGKATFNRKVDDTVRTIGNARKADAVVTTVQEYQTPLIIAGAVALLFFLSRDA